MNKLLEALAFALRQYQPDLEEDQPEFADIDVVDGELLMLIDGQPVAVKIEEL